jgi:hypothetical protein
MSARRECFGVRRLDGAFRRREPSCHARRYVAEQKSGDKSPHSKAAAIFRRIAVQMVFLIAQSPGWAAPDSSNDIPPLRPPHAEIPPTLWERHTTGVIVVGMAVLAIAGFAVWLALRPRPPVIVPPEVQARGDLESLSKLPEDGAVLSKVSQAVRRYFGTAFALPAGELTTAEFCRAIAANDQIGSDLSASTGDFLRRCDERKFAPDSTPQATGAAEYALRLVEQAETRRERLRRAAQSKPESIAKT